jgi:hypothetical protein
MIYWSGSWRDDRNCCSLCGHDYFGFDGILQSCGQGKTMNKIIARENLVAVLGKIMAFYEPVDYPCKEFPLPPFKKEGKATDPFSGREEWERRLERKLGAAFKDQITELLDLMGDPPRFENVPQEYWEKHGTNLRKLFTDTLTDIALERAEEFLVAAPIGGVDWMQVHASAVEWARGYSYDLAKDITDSQRTALQQEVGRFFEDGTLTIDDIARDLEVQFSPKRAEMIAVTETTRAAVNGERSVVAEIEKYGIQMQAVWQTSNDEIVMECEICWPKQGEVITDGDFPPAHPNCRCWVNHEVIPPSPPEKDIRSASSLLASTSSANEGGQ